MFYPLWFVDFQKALDEISGNALYYKLNSMGMSIQMINRIKQLYKRVEFCVKVGANEATNPIQSHVGLRQGCQMSPILFSLYINDIDTLLRKTDIHPPFIENTEIPVLLYADDLLVMSVTQVGMQRALDTLSKYCEKWQLKVNCTKTKIIIFKKGPKISKQEKWVYKGREIEIVNTFKYLGVTVTYNGKWIKHQTQAVSATEKGMFIAQRAIYRGRVLSTTLLTRIFDVMIQPIVIYGSEVWGTACADKHINKPHNKFCKQLLGVAQSAPNSGVLLELGRLPTSMMVKKQVLKYWLKLKTQNNKEIQKLCLTSQIKDRNRETWLKEVYKILNDLGLNKLIQDDKHNLRDTLKEITRSLAENFFNLLIEDCQTKISLHKFMEIKTKAGKEKYVDLNKEDRRVIAIFRLGIWKWEGRKDGEGVRRCVMCEEEESEEHVIFKCTGYANMRGTLLLERYAVKGEGAVNEMFKLEDRNELKSLAKQLKAMLDKRREALATLEREQSPFASPSASQIENML